MKKYLMQTGFIIFLLIPLNSIAATIGASIGGNLSLEMDPINPDSNTQVKVNAVSYEADLNTAKISWYLNGQLEKEGIGQTNYTFQTGNIGQLSSFKAVIQTDNKRIEKTITINPAGVDIVWEANTYVPPLYKGKALASPDSVIKASAIPNLVSENGTKLSPDDLFYEWSFNNQTVSSGYAKKDVKITTGSPYGSDNITVKVSNKVGNIVAEKTIEIKPENTNIIFYEDKSIEGTNFSSALTNEAILSEKEITLRAEPYFFSYPNSADEKNLMFYWSINNKGIKPNEDLPKTITLRNETGQQLTSNISLSIKNMTRVFQSTFNTLILNSSGVFNF